MINLASRVNLQCRFYPCWHNSQAFLTIHGNTKSEIKIIATSKLKSLLTETKPERMKVLILDENARVMGGQ